MIRFATASDLPYLADQAEWYLCYSAEGAFIDMDRAYCMERMGQIIASPDCLVLIADEGGPIGHLAATAHVTLWAPEVRFLRVFSLWVAPERRGAKAARELLQAAEAWAAEHGITAILPDANHAFKPAAIDKFYRRAGYEPVETVYLKRVSHGH